VAVSAPVLTYSISTTHLLNPVTDNQQSHQRLPTKHIDHACCLHAPTMLYAGHTPLRECSQRLPTTACHQRPAASQPTNPEGGNPHRCPSAARRNRDAAVPSHLQIKATWSCWNIEMHKGGARKCLQAPMTSRTHTWRRWMAYCDKRSICTLRQEGCAHRQQLAASTRTTP
jgi:hypothetical protein